jgi:hypothetical protein
MAAFRKLASHWENLPHGPDQMNFESPISQFNGTKYSIPVVHVTNTTLSSSGRKSCLWHFFFERSRSTSSPRNRRVYRRLDRVKCKVI